MIHGPTRSAARQHSAITTPHRIAQGLLVLAVALAALLWLQSSRSSDDAPAPRAAATAAQQPAWQRLQGAAGAGASVPASRRALRQSFRALRGPSEPLPPRLQTKVKETLGAPANVRFTSTQELRTSRGTVWIASAGAATCLIQASHGAVSCDATAKVARRGLVLGVYATTAAGSAKDFVMLGIAPDWARRARLRVGARTREVAVGGNAYALGAATAIGLDRLVR